MHKNTVPVTAAALGCLLLAYGSPEAAQPQVVARLQGEAYVVRPTTDGTQVATWSRNRDGNYALQIIGTDKGRGNVVTTTDSPGGLCWIAGTRKLLYCKSKHVSNTTLPYNRISYYTIAAGEKDAESLTEVNDLLDTYLFDPISSEDGQRIFHMTIGTRRLPSFNLYFADRDSLKALEVNANIGSDYDLSSDGTMLYWQLNDQSSGDMSIVGWNLDAAQYTELYTYPASKDPAQLHQMLRVNTPGSQAACMVQSSTDETLKLCVYNFKDPRNLTVVPIRLAATDDVIHFDWRSRSGPLYAVVQNGKTFRLIEIDIATQKQTVLVTTNDEIQFAEYASGAKAYFYSTVDAKKRETAIVRLAP